MKDLRDFNAVTCSIDSTMTIIMRMKLTGLPDKVFEKAKKFIITKLKFRVNEEEKLLTGDESVYSGKLNEIYSAETKEGSKDMLQWTFRVKDSFFTSFDQYVTFPFDILPFRYRFELSHFEIDKETYRFDFYNTVTNWLSWKPNCDFLPEFDIDYPSTKIETLMEDKPHEIKDKDGNKTKIKCKYYPGFILTFYSVRNPRAKMIKVLFPSLVLFVFLCATFLLSIDDLANRLMSLSICLLTYINILDTLRSEMP